MRRLIASVLAAMASFAMVLGAMVATAAAAPAVPQTPYCGITWGSQPKQAGSMVQTRVRDVRAGQHPCFDRLVIDLQGRAPGYDVRYVPTVTQDGSGSVVPLRGGAKLQIVVRAPSYSTSGKTTYAPTNKAELRNVNGYSTFRQCRYW